MTPLLSGALLRAQTDECLTTLVKQGNEGAFDALVHRYRRALVRYCRRIVGDEGQAEDAVQQALLSAWSALQHGPEIREFRPWVYRIVRNAALNTLRASPAESEQLHESLWGDCAPEEHVSRRAEALEALAGLASLPHLQREALTRTAIGGHSRARVAAELDLSETALRGLIYRARQGVRAACSVLTPPPVLVLAAGRVRALTATLPQGVAASSGGAGGAGGAIVLLAKCGMVAAGAGTIALGALGTAHHRPPSSRLGMADRKMPVRHPSLQAALAPGDAPRLAVPGSLGQRPEGRAAGPRAGVVRGDARPVRLPTRIAPAPRSEDRRSPGSEPEVPTTADRGSPASDGASLPSPERNLATASGGPGPSGSTQTSSSGGPGPSSGGSTSTTSSGGPGPSSGGSTSTTSSGGPGPSSGSDGQAVLTGASSGDTLSSSTAKGPSGDLSGPWGARDTDKRPPRRGERVP